MDSMDFGFGFDLLSTLFLELTLGQVALWCYCVRFMCLYLVKAVNDV